MSLHHMGFVAAILGLLGGAASAQHIVPSALLTIDQNRPTVVDRIVNQWGDHLVRSNAGISSAQLREILNGLRADHLLAASLAGSVEGLRDVVSGALVHTDAAVSPGLMHTKALGDTGDDLVYTPVVPCRILDTRNGTTPPYNAPMMGGSAFPVAANLANFAPQGGSATNCNLPASFQAIAVTLTVLNPNFDAFLAASSSSNFATLTQSVVMDFSANKGLANTAVVPVDGTVKFYLGLPAQVTTQVIADAVGYFRGPNGNGGQFFRQGGNAFGVPATLGTTDNRALSLMVNNVAALRLFPETTSPILVGGHPNNSVVFSSASGSTIGGGGAAGTSVLGFSCLPSDCANRITDAFGTIGGGAANIAGNSDGDPTNAPFATVGGGLTNTASRIASTVAGGAYNSASGVASTVGGGQSNIASSDFSTVGGGFNSTASGPYATVPGGNQNVASGAGSFAAGQFATASNTGSFVWGDGTGAAGSTGDNRFSVRATGGVDFFISTGNCNFYPGATMWTCSSDRNLKENFATLDARGVLRHLSAMPVMRWNFKGHPEKPHIGPVAQDFHAAFGLSDRLDDTHIDAGDAIGVALAAIKGLHQLVNQKDAKLRAQDHKLNEQSGKISTIELELATIKEKLNMRK